MRAYECVCLHVCEDLHVYMCVHMCGLKPMDLGALGTRVCRKDRIVSSNKVDTGQN